MTTMDAIRNLEEQVGADRARALRKELDLPSIDGAPEAWLVRYRDGLHAMLSATSSTGATAGNRPPVHDLTDFFADQAARVKARKRYQVWRGAGAPSELLGTTNDRREAEKQARESASPGLRTWILGPADLFDRRLPNPDAKDANGKPRKPAARVRDADFPAPPRETKRGVPYWLRVTVRETRGTKKVLQRGPWAPPPPPPKAWTETLARIERLAAAEDGTAVSSLGMSTATAKRLAHNLGIGEVTGGRGGRLRKKLAVVRLRIEMEKREGVRGRVAVVRRAK